MVALDLVAVRKLPGVAAAISLLGPDRTVRFAGQEIAAVAATNLKMARAALNAIRVRYEILPGAIGMDEARRAEAPKVFSGFRKTLGNVSEGPMLSTRWSKNLRGPSGGLSDKPGKARKMLEAAKATADPLLVEGIWRTQAQSHTSFEPHAAVAQFNGEHLTVYLSTQAVHEHAKLIAEKYQLPAENVRVIADHAATPALRREQIKLQVALITPFLHVKGFAAPETKAAADRARLLIEQAEALGEPAEDPLLLFSVLYSFWVANLVASNADAARELAVQFLALAEKQGATVLLMIGHRLIGVSLVQTGDIAEGRAHLDQAIALYNPAEHRPLATRFGQDVRVAALSWRSMALWLLGYPKAALAVAEYTLKDAREIGQAATLMYALAWTSFTQTFCGNYATASAQSDEVVPMADETGSVLWKAYGMLNQGCVLALTVQAMDAVQIINSGLTAYRSTGTTMWMPMFLSDLARTCAGLGQFDDAWRCIGEAMTTMETTNERWFEAEVHRTAGEVVLASRKSDAAKAGPYFRACARGCARAASKVLGTARGDELGAASVRSGQTG